MGVVFDSTGSGRDGTSAPKSVSVSCTSVKSCDVHSSAGNVSWKRLIILTPLSYDSAVEMMLLFRIVVRKSGELWLRVLAVLGNMLPRLVLHARHQNW